VQWGLTYKNPSYVYGVYIETGELSSTCTRAGSCGLTYFPDVAGVIFSNPDSTLVLKFLNPDPDLTPKFFKMENPTPVKIPQTIYATKLRDTIYKDHSDAYYCRK